LAEITRQSSQEDLKEVTADDWLSMEIYKLTPPATQIRSLTLADAQRVAAKLFKDAATAKIVVGDADQLKKALGRPLKSAARSLRRGQLILHLQRSPDRFANPSQAALQPSSIPMREN